MKIKCFLCFLLACLLLVGCSSEVQPSGDMEKALNCLKWQDYEGALSEAEAFLKRVPNSVPAKNIRETAAWSILDLAIENSTEIELKKGTAVKTYNGFVVENLPVEEGAQFHLMGYEIKTSSDNNYFNLDFTTYRIYLSAITLYWKYPGSNREYEYIIYSPDQLRKENLGEFLSDYYYGGDKLSTDTHEEFIEYLQTTLVASFDEVFGVIAKKYHIQAEQIGFENWNQPVKIKG